jgi:hypothetical protein
VRVRASLLRRLAVVLLCAPHDAGPPTAVAAVASLLPTAPTALLPEVHSPARPTPHRHSLTH